MGNGKADFTRGWRLGAGGSEIPSSDSEELMRIAMNIVGVILLFFGCVWFLQGINILPGSFMTGQIKWAVNGGIAFVIGVGVLVFANRRR